MSALSSPEVFASSREAARGWWSGWPGRCVRVVFALLPLFWLSQRIGLGEVYARAREVGLFALWLSVTAIMTSIGAASVRWSMLLRAYGASETPPWWTLARHFLVGGYFSVLPSGMAGDVVRGMRVRRFVPDLKTSYVVIFVERLAGLMGLCLVAFVASMTSPTLRTSVVTTVLNLAFVGGVTLSTGVLLMPYVIARSEDLRGFVARIPWLGGVILGVPRARVLWRLLVGWALSVVTQTGVVVAVWAIMTRLCPWVTFGLCARVVPGVILFTYVPLTPGGLGQREAAFTYLFGLAGVGADTAVATSLLYFGVSMGVALLGGLCLVYERLAGIED